MYVDWGSVPDWLAGGGAVTALWWARKAVKAATETNRQQTENIDRLNEERRERQEAEQRIQADRVAAWVAPAPSWSASVTRITVRCRNASDLPIYNLSSVLYLHRFPLAIQKHGLVQPASTEQLHYPERYTLLINEHSADEFDASFIFRDAAGTWWIREIDGVLKATDLQTVHRYAKDREVAAAEHLRRLESRGSMD